MRRRIALRREAAQPGGERARAARHADIGHHRGRQAQIGRCVDLHLGRAACEFQHRPARLDDAARFGEARGDDPILRRDQYRVRQHVAAAPDDRRGSGDLRGRRPGGQCPLADLGTRQGANAVQSARPVGRILRCPRIGGGGGELGLGLRRSGVGVGLAQASQHLTGAHRIADLNGERQHPSGPFEREHRLAIGAHDAAELAERAACGMDGHDIDDRRIAIGLLRRWRRTGGQG